jgi:L-lactate utilization protein LutB
MNSKRWYYETFAQKTVESLIRNGINALFINTAEEAKKVILELIPSDAKIGFGGSVTLKQIGLLEDLERKGFNLLNS